MDADKEKAKKRYVSKDIVNFKKSSEIAELGFCITEKNEGIKYNTKDGHYFTLRYIGSNIENFSDYYKLAHSFGDLYTIKKIEEFLEVCKSDVERNVKEAVKYIELYFILLSIYNPKLFQMYLKRLKKIIVNDCGKKINDRLLTNLYSHLEKLSSDINIDYKMNSKIDVYYHSGYICFYSTNKKDFINGEEPIINYRARYGSKMNICHPLLRFELVSILGVLTSDSWTIPDMESKIGKLHFLYIKS